MVKLVMILALTNALSLSAAWYFRHELEELKGNEEIRNLTTYLHGEYLMKTSIMDVDKFVRVYATPTIFRSLEECNKTQNEWNSKQSMGRHVWRCEKYGH